MLSLTFFVPTKIAFLGVFRLFALFRLCSTNVLTVVDLYFDCARPMFGLCSNYVSTVLDICFDFLDRNRICIRMPTKTYAYHKYISDDKMKQDKIPYFNLPYTILAYDNYILPIQPKPICNKIIIIFFRVNWNRNDKNTR